VKASFDHIIFPPPGILSPRKGVFDTVQEVKVVDPLTVQFILSAPRSFFLAAIASGWNVIYRKRLYTYILRINLATRKSGTMLLFHHLCEGALLWYLTPCSTNSCCSP